MPFLGSRQCEEGSPAGSRPWKLRPFRSVFKDRDHGWGPLLWVLYLGFFFVQPIVDHVSLKQWLFDGLGGAIFLVLYWGLFLLGKPRGLVHIGGMVLLGVLFLPFNAGACTFFIFAAAMVPFSVETQARAIACLFTIAGIGGIAAFHRYGAGWALFYSGIFPLLIGGSNVFFAERNRMNRRLRKANDEIEQLAKVAERERIARDLHDVLGHTLSVIILKSELAGKIIDRSPEGGGKE